MTSMTLRLRALLPTSPSAAALAVGNVVLGVMAASALAPWSFWPLMPLAIAMLFWGASDATPRQGLAMGWRFGLGYFAVVTHWLHHSLWVYGGLPWWVAALCILLLACFLALYHGVVVWLALKSVRASSLRLLLALPLLWAAGDWVRGWLFTGFPWGATGYAGVPDAPWSGWLAVMGVYGVGLLLALLAGCLAWSLQNLRPPRFRAALLGGGAVLILLVSGVWLQTVQWTQPLGQPVRVSLVQGSIPQDVKWDVAQLEFNLETYLNLAGQAKGQIVILPETAIPLFMHEIPGEYWVALRGPALRRQQTMVVGVPVLESGQRYYNSAVVVTDRQWPSYSKSHLVPFGEFMPLRPLFGWVYNYLNIPLSDFSAREGVQAPFALAGQKLAMNICYEDVFGEEIIRTLPEATLLANISNLAWFDGTVALAQHLQISSARAMESGRVMLRATNTGATAAISPEGKILARLPERVRGVLEVQVQGRSGLTPYARWGNSLFLASLAVLAIILIGLRRTTPNE